MLTQTRHFFVRSLCMRSSREQFTRPTTTDTANVVLSSSVLWRLLDCLDLCSVACRGQPFLPEQNTSTTTEKTTVEQSNNNNKVTQQKNNQQPRARAVAAVAALTILEVDFEANAPILRPLTTNALYAALCRQLHVMRIIGNQYDESVDDLSEALAVLEQLRELSIQHSGLTSLRGLRGHCGNLRKVDVWASIPLTSLDGLDGSHIFLEEINVSHTGITSVLELRHYTALRIVNVGHLKHLRSLEGLEHHSLLEEINASETAITSVNALRECHALRKVLVCGCPHLSSLTGLENHALLEEINASRTAITSIVRELQGCPSLKKGTLYSCRGLTSQEKKGLLSQVQVIF